MIDIHSHVIPAIDDGPSSLSESLHGLRQLEECGVTAVIATPHLSASTIENGRALGAYIERADARNREMLDAAAGSGLTISIHRGFEVMLDRPRPDFSDPRLRLANTRYVLVEFPRMSIPPNSHLALGRISEAGFTPIVAHPEQSEELIDRISVLEEWRHAGALLQLNLGSLGGDYGSRARRAAWLILERGLADFLAGDFHGRGRHPLERAQTEMLQRHAADQLETLTRVNPGRLLDDLSPLPVPPISLSARGRLGPTKGR